MIRKQFDNWRKQWCNLLHGISVRSFKYLTWYCRKVIWMMLLYLSGLQIINVLTSGVVLHSVSIFSIHIRASIICRTPKLNRINLAWFSLSLQWGIETLKNTSRYNSISQPAGHTLIELIKWIYCKAIIFQALRLLWILSTVWQIRSWHMHIERKIT